MVAYNLVLKEDGYEEYPLTDYYADLVEELGLTNRVVHLQEDSKCYAYPKQKFFFGKDGELVFKGIETQIILTDKHLEFKGDLQEEYLYLNKKRIREDHCLWSNGDVLLVGDHKLILREAYLEIIGALDYEVLLNPLSIGDVPFSGYPLYKRSPRIIKRVSTDKIEVKTPPQKVTASKTSLLQTILPPLGMLAMTVGIGLLIGRGIFLLMSIGGTVMAVVISLIKFFNDSKERKETNKKRKEVYEKYLLNKRKEIFKKYEGEKEAYQYNYPTLKELERMIHGYSSRIYERTQTDEDFLTISLGNQVKSTSFEISTQYDELVLDKDNLKEQAENIKAQYKTLLKNKVIDLKNAHLGLVGSKGVIHEQLKIYISQLVTFQSYHDLQFIAIYDEQYQEDFQWMSWLPHSKIQALNVLGLIHSERSRDQVLNSLNQILKERQLKVEESKKEAKFAPHFLFIIDEPKLIMDHSIMEFLDKDGDALGFSIIYTSHLRANLPENIGTVLLLEHSQEGELLLEEKELKGEKIILPHVGAVELEKMARNLAVLKHIKGMSTQIPESITFFELYGITKTEELKVRSRWQQNESHKSLSVPLGLRGVNDVVNLNLHEKEHGPHGLVAGTTGSGKSEIVQSYILSLAVNFHPYEVGFLLIDYKGGGMAGLFKDLPHLLGTITNLDGSESMRAMASIKSELARRQRIFSKNDVNHINNYNQLFKEKKVEEPIPHLFIISDEFAELKKEQPDFMKELVSAARIGRSLGVHLILATQKPTGVVDEQIWSNSKFKLALKVQNESDSKEILKTPDAASITQPGRAYLQVGNNEIYELFQSAWSGAMYVVEQEKDVALDNRVYVLNELGQRVLVNQDLSGSKIEQKAKDTQLDVVVRHIKEVYESGENLEVKRPWFPSLEKQIISPLALEETSFEEGSVMVKIGLLDIPEEQKQEEYVLDLTKDGNVLYIASSGYGKSLFLTTIAISLALAYEVSKVNLYILDFGNNALVPLRNLPHTSDYITMDDEECFGKFQRLIQSEMKYRKKCLAKVMAQNFQVYNQTATEPLRAIVVLVDNFDAVKEMGFDMEEYFTKVTRDGAGLGIYFVLTATRMNGIRSATINNFKNKIAGFNFEKGEIQGLVGRCIYALPEIKGRAMVKKGELVSALQVYTMVNFENQLEYGKKIQNLIGDVRLKYPGEEAPHIPILPEDFTISMMEKYTKEKADLYLGLEKEGVVLCGLERLNSPFFIVGEAGKGKTNALKILLEQGIGKGKVVLFDAKNRGLYEYAQKDGVQYVSGIKAFIAYMDELEEEVLAREQKQTDLIQNNLKTTPIEVAKTFEPYYIFVDDLDDFEALGTNATGEIALMLERAGEVGITLIVTGHVSKLKGIDEVTVLMKSAQDGLLVSSQGYANIFSISMQEDQVDFGEGLLINNGVCRTILLPKA